jgi:hypothetical protein
MRLSAVMPIVSHGLIIALIIAVILSASIIVMISSENVISHMVLSVSVPVVSVVVLV